MMTRCKPLLGTLVEITIDDEEKFLAINRAFSAIEKIQELMGFHRAESELNQINRIAHKKAIDIHPWTAQVLRTAKNIHRHSGGLFDCGVGHRLVTAGLLPKHAHHTQYELGGIGDICFLSPELITASRPVCLDLGGIAKGFAVDIAVKILLSEGALSGVVNAGGDLRVFGEQSRPIHLRNPRQPSQFIEIGNLKNAALATSSLYFAKRDQQMSHFINPLAMHTSEIHLDTSDSYSMLAKECIYADALTKVLVLSEREDHPCFKTFSAQAIRIPA